MKCFVAKMRWLCKIYTRGAQDEAESECIADGGYDRTIETVRLGASHKCEPGDHRLDLVGEGKERTDPWAAKDQG